MLSITGRKEKLSASKGSVIEVSSNECYHTTGSVWYRALLLQNLIAQSKRTMLSVRHLNPLSNEYYSPPLITTAVHRLIRPLPPLDLFHDVGFEEGDVIDAAHKGGWWSGWVIKVLGSGRFLVYLRFEPDVIEVERKDLRPHMVWKDEEWFRCQKRDLIASEFSAGTKVEVKTKVEPFGSIWSPAITIKENEDGTLLVKYKSLGGECRKKNVPYSEIRPSPPPFGSRCFGLLENVDALLECGWCPSIVSKVLCGDRYTVLLGRNKLSKDFDHSQLRISMEFKDGAWQTQRNAHEESVNRESVNKRKRGQQPCKLRSTKPKQKTWESASRTPDPMLSSMLETPKAKETRMVLPFVKKSPCWKVFESMEIFKAVPQRPHFSPLLESEEEFREGEAIGATVNYIGLLEKVRDIQVHDSVSMINRIKECFLKLEKHGFDLTGPITRIHKLLSIKASQTRALEELQVAEKEIAEKDNKRRKLEDDIEQVSEKIVELQRQETLMKEEKVKNEKEIARMKYRLVSLDRMVQWEFRATAKAPWY
ncbi:hypothetical protein Bca4012_039135 [Brassica carinata]